MDFSSSSVFDQHKGKLLAINDEICLRTNVLVAANLKNTVQNVLCSWDVLGNMNSSLIYLSAYADF